jgi:hypothetical protein
LRAEPIERRYGGLTGLENDRDQEHQPPEHGYKKKWNTLEQLIAAPWPGIGIFFGHNSSALWIGLSRWRTMPDSKNATRESGWQEQCQQRQEAKLEAALFVSNGLRCQRGDRLPVTPSRYGRWFCNV